MRVIVLGLAIGLYLFGKVDFGSIAFSKSDNIVASKIINLFREYNITIKGEEFANSKEMIKYFTDNNSSSFFAIIPKNIYKKLYKDYYKYLTVISNLSHRRIHIFGSEGKNLNFETKKEFNIYCGEIDSDSCIDAKTIEKAYNVKFNYDTNLSIDEAITKIDKNIDLIIISSYTAVDELTKIKGIKIVDLPTNFKLENTFTHSFILPSEYDFVSEKIDALSVPVALVSIIDRGKYKEVLETISKIILLNKEYLIKKYHFKNEDFTYSDYEKFLKFSKKLLSTKYENR